MSIPILDPQSGQALSAEHQRIAEIIKDYDPSLELAWIPPNERDFNDTQPFAVLHRTEAGVVDYIVFKLKESEVDHRVLSRLFTGDNAKNDVLTVIEAEETARQLVQAKKELDEAEEAQELAAWAIKARSGAKHNGVRFE